MAGDPAYDAYAGDIRNATATFVLWNSTNTAYTVIASAPIGLVSSTDTKTGTATYNWGVDIGSQNSQTYNVGIVVGGYYLRNSPDDQMLVTVSKPLNSFITGGGYLNLTSSSGLKAGDAGSKNNFGFNVKFNSSGTNLQGNINIIVRRTELSDGIQHVYQIKGNSMTSLSTPPNMPGVATFNGKASIQDITNPLYVISVDGNATLQVNMTDNGDPGSWITPDTIGITVWNKSGGMWFSSNWNGTSTIPQPLGNGYGMGNVVVHSNGQVLGGPAQGPGSNQVLTNAMLEPIVREAIRRWEMAGADAQGIQALKNVQYEITDLPDGYLGWTAHQVIMLDVNGAGYGYFIDPTPGNDSEFTLGQKGPAAGRVDLLTVVMHEMGHILGINEVVNHPGDVMGEYIPVGVRELPSEQDLANLGVQQVCAHGQLAPPVIQQVSALAPPTGHAGMVAHAPSTDLAFNAGLGIVGQALPGKFLSYRHSQRKLPSFPPTLPGGHWFFRFQASGLERRPSRSDARI